MSRQKLAPQPLSYRVVFERDGDGWHVTIPTIQGCHTWGRSIREARKNIREALACCVDVFGSEAAADEAAKNAELVESFPASLLAVVKRHQRAQETAARARELTVETARRLTETVSLRDTGELLGMSAEGVRKLTADKPKREQRARG